MDCCCCNYALVDGQDGKRDFNSVFSLLDVGCSLMKGTFWVFDLLRNVFLSHFSLKFGYGYTQGSSPLLVDGSDLKLGLMFG